MEFFDWISIPQYVLYFVSFQADTGAEAAAQERWIMVICLISAAALYLVCHLFGGFGLMTMAKKQGIKNWWLGFLPFGNTYLSGKLAGEAVIFNKKCKRIGLYTVITEIVFVALEIALFIVIFQFYRGEFYELNNYEGVQYWEFSGDLVEACYPGTGWIVTLYKVLTIVSDVWWFVMLVAFFFLYTTFFRKYYARSPFLMTFLCAVLPVRGFVLFAVRNNKPLDYTAYIRSRMEAVRRAQGGYDNRGYGDDYGETQSGPSPFGEFGNTGNTDNTGNAGGGTDIGTGNSGDSPFSDF